MRKKTHRRPEVERLESMTLLSGMAGMAHQAAAPVTFPHPLSLTGTVSGTLKTKGAGSSSVKASGALSPLGQVKLSGGVSGNGTTGEVGNLTVTTKQGKLLIGFSATPSGQGAS